MSFKLCPRLLEKLFQVTARETPRVPVPMAGLGRVKAARMRPRTRRNSYSSLLPPSVWKDVLYVHRIVATSLAYFSRYVGIPRVHTTKALESGVWEETASRKWLAGVYTYYGARPYWEVGD
jgi:hypothetical protein